ncbi:MAG: peptidylprolyl isomerase [Planctomycetes bacterium]|nr:peptidylprolyl isomerase [Planctomycetota bacterium]
MAKKRGNRRSGMLFAFIGAVVLGAVIGVMLYNDPGMPLPPPPEVDFDAPYDDSWGRLPTPVARCAVTHILLKIDENRTEEEAKHDIEQLWNLYKNRPTKEFWTELQQKNNEDSSDKTHVYPIPGPQPYQPEFEATGKSTKVGFARICKTTFGYHLVRRES